MLRRRADVRFEVDFRGETVIIEDKPDLHKVYIEINNTCNLNCKMCYRRSWKDPLGFMKEEVFEKLCSDLKAFPEIREVVVGGIGEPTFHPMFKEWITRLVKRGWYVKVTTNGTLINDDLAELLVSLPVGEVIISVDSPEEDVFADIRGISLSTVFDATRRLIQKRKERSQAFPRVFWEMVIMKENVHLIEKEIQKAAEFGVSGLILSNIIPFAEEVKNDPIYPLTYEEALALKDKLYLWSVRYGVKLEIPEFTIKSERYCPFVLDHATVIGWDGEVLPCYRLSHTYTEWVIGEPVEVQRYSFGNIMNESLYDIWNKPEYRLFRLKVKTNQVPDCATCDFKGKCLLMESTWSDCWGNMPSCAACLWYHRFALCP